MKNNKKTSLKKEKLMGNKIKDRNRTFNNSIKSITYKEEEFKSNDINNDNMVEGRNAVIEILKSDKTIESIYVSKGNISGSINTIIKMAKEKGVIIKEVDRKKLDSMSNTNAHQGVIAVTTPFEYSTINEILQYAKEKSEDPFIIILDELEDPHNMGAIIRTAEVCGVHGIIIPKRRNVGITPIVYKTSVGAVEYMKIAKVTNLNACIEELKEKGIWIYGADMHGREYCYQTNLRGPIGLVIGSEGRGISKGTKEKCDALIKIPMAGQINSLNASIAAAIVMYETLKQRLNKE